MEDSEQMDALPQILASPYAGPVVMVVTLAVAWFAWHLDGDDDPQ